MSPANRINRAWLHRGANKETVQTPALACVMDICARAHTPLTPHTETGSEVNRANQDETRMRSTRTRCCRYGDALSNRNSVNLRGKHTLAQRLA